MMIVELYIRRSCLGLKNIESFETYTAARNLATWQVANHKLSITNRTSLTTKTCGNLVKKIRLYVHTALFSSCTNTKLVSTLFSGIAGVKVPSRDFRLPFLLFSLHLHL